MTFTMVTSKTNSWLPPAMKTGCEKQWGYSARTSDGEITARAVHNSWDRRLGSGNGTRGRYCGISCRAVSCQLLFGYPDGAMHSACTNLTSTECGNIRERLWIVDRVSIRLMPKHNEQGH